MIERRAGVVIGLLVLANLAIGALGLWQLPPDHLVAIHFDLAGKANGWARPTVAFLVNPAVAAFIWGLWFLLPRITPRGENLRRSAGAYGMVFVAAALVVLAIQGVMVASALGAPVQVASASPAIIGVMFVVIGNVLPKLRWNYVVGIRTPWTLADERVWDKTHRFGGWVMVICGLIMVLGALVPPFGPKPGLVAGVIGAGAFLTFGKSYLLWREIQGKGHA